MGRLYVIVQGLFVVQETALGIDLILPDVPGHVQRAGNWLAETDMAPGAVLTLNGIGSNGTASFRQKDFMIQLQNATITPNGRAATIHCAQRPLDILGLLLVEDPSGALVVSSKANPAIGNRRVATAHVLIFDVPDLNALELNGHAWEPYSVDGATSLHIISTSELPEPWAHNDATGGVLSTVVHGYPGYNFPPRVAPPDWRWATNHPSYGVLGSAALGTALTPQDDRFLCAGKFAFCQQQLEPYESRHVRLGLAGRLIQERRGIDTAWNLTTPIGVRVTNCVGYV